MQTRYVVADFDKNANIAFYDNLMSQVADLDIGLVILNAGVGNGGWFVNESIEHWQQLLDVNVYQYSIMTHKFCKMLEARKAERSGFIVTGSVASEIPGMQMSFAYGATKAFVKYLIKSMAYEHSVSDNAKRSKIDLLCLQPGMVKTKMIKPLEDMGRAIAVVSTEECVEATLNDLGNGKHCTFGASAHHKFIRVLEVFVKYLNPVVNNRKYRKKKDATKAK